MSFSRATRDARFISVTRSLRYSWTCRIEIGKPKTSSNISRSTGGPQNATYASCGCESFGQDHNIVHVDCLGAALGSPVHAPTDTCCVDEPGITGPAMRSMNGPSPDMRRNCPVMALDYMNGVSRPDFYRLLDAHTHEIVQVHAHRNR